MSFFEVQRQALTGAFRAGFVDSNGNPLFPVEYANLPFDKPDGPWARFSIRGAERRHAAIGKDFVRQPGLVYLQCFAKDDKGITSTTAMADKMVETLDDLTIMIQSGFIVLYTTTLDYVGKDADGWYCHNATCRFRHDQFGASDPADIVIQAPASLLSSVVGDAPGSLDYVPTVTLANRNTRRVLDLSGPNPVISEWVLLAGNTDTNVGAGTVRPDDYDAVKNQSYRLRVS